MGLLGMVAQAQGRMHDATRFYRRCLELREEQLGAEHADTLKTATNLGLCLHLQAASAEAEPLLRRCVKGFGRVLGPSHPMTLGSQHNLSLVLTALGQMTEAKGPAANPMAMIVHTWVLPHRDDCPHLGDSIPM